jgi:hypothetical protein
MDTAQDLKRNFPIYPEIKRREMAEGDVEFQTLIRKRYNKVYYLIPKIDRGPQLHEAYLIHRFNVEVYRYFMLGLQQPYDVKDDDQTNEVTRLQRTLIT